MNLGKIRTKTIQIIREYSNNGVLIGGDNKDYLMSMNSFINDAQFELIEKRPLIKKITLGNADEITETYNKYNMPSNFRSLKMIKLNDDIFEDYDFEYLTLIIPKVYTGIFNIWYSANPTIIDETNDDNTVLEIDEDLQMIIPYYAAGHVIIDENPSLAEYFLVEYEKKKSSIKLKNSSKRVRSVYDF